MTLVAVILAGSALALKMLANVQRSTEPAAVTAQVLAEVEKAMVRFVLMNRRLPCAADGRIASGAPQAGMELINTTLGPNFGDCLAAGVNTGVVPWVTLLIAEKDAQDGWGSRLTYRVPTGTEGFTRTLAFDMSSCAPAGRAGTTVSSGARICQLRPAKCPVPVTVACTGPTQYMSGRGISIRDGAGAVVMDASGITGGAAYVVISAGANLVGAYNSSGVVRAVAGTAAGTGELTNRNNQALQAFYVDATRDTSATTSHFDDVVLRPSISTVLTQAKLGPRP